MTREISGIFTELRTNALAFVDPDAPQGDLYGVLMELGLDVGVATLVALGDGGVSLYLSGGGGFLGAGENDVVARSARRFAQTAMRFVEEMPGDQSDLALAEPGETKFFVLIGSAVLSISARTADLQRGLHPLAPLHRAGHALLAEVNAINPDG